MLILNKIVVKELISVLSKTIIDHFYHANHNATRKRKEERTTSLHLWSNGLNLYGCENAPETLPFNNISDS